MIPTCEARRRGWPASPWAAGLLLLALSACPEPAGAPSSAAGQVRRYTVRAEVVGLPTPGRPVRELTVRHEPIDDFADRTGAVVGMGSMVMAIPLAPGLSLPGIAAGDAVELRLAVDFARPGLWVEQVERLPAGTALRFGPARPAAVSAPPAAPAGSSRR